MVGRAVVGAAAEGVQHAVVGVDAAARGEAAIGPRDGIGRRRRRRPRARPARSWRRRPAPSSVEAVATGWRRVRGHRATGPRHGPRSPADLLGIWWRTGRPAGGQQVTSRGGTMPNVVLLRAGPRRRRSASAGGAVAGAVALGRSPGPRCAGRRSASARTTCIGRLGQRRLAAEHRQHGLHVVAVDARLEHGGAADRAAGRPRSGTSGSRLARRRLSTPANSISLAGDSSLSVTTSPPVAALDQPTGDARVEQALGEHARQRAAQEVLLAGDAPEVGRRVLVPVAAAGRVLVLVLAASARRRGRGRRRT